MWFRSILSIILINLLVFFALISIHEISHVTAGMLLGCKNQVAVLLDSNLIGPYTESYCTGNSTIIYVIGLMVTASFSLLFLFLNSSTKRLFFTSMGLSVLFSSIDFSIITNIQYLFYLMASAGFLMIIIGEYSLANSYVKGDIIDFLDIS